MQLGKYEAIAIQAARNALDGRTVEDRRVELKSELPEPEAAARQVAALLNALRGERGVWVVGVNEKQRSLVPVEATQDLASWRDGFVRHYELPAPNFENFIVQFNGDSQLLVLVFEQERLPCVVKNPVYGKPGGGNVELEVPWRYGNSTRSAKRSELLSLLYWSPPIPSVVFEGASVSMDFNNHNQQAWLKCEALAYVVPEPGTTAILQIRQCSIDARRSGQNTHEALEIRSLEPRCYNASDTGGAIRRQALNQKIVVTPDDVSFGAPGLVRLLAFGQPRVLGADSTEADQLELVIGLHFIGHAVNVQLAQVLSKSSGRIGPDSKCAWTFGITEVGWK